MRTENGSNRRENEEESRLVIHLEEELCLAAAAPARELLLGACATGRETVIDLSATVDADLGGLQLLVSACQTFSHKGIRLQLTGAREEFLRVAREGGFEALCSTCALVEGA